MNPSTFVILRRHALRPNTPLSKASSCLLTCHNQFSFSRSRSFSSDLEFPLSPRVEAFKARRNWDKLSAKTSSDLSTILSKYLPPSCRVPKPPLKRMYRDPYLPVPQGHHQVYFNNVFSELHLLPDGTDDAHSPGPPFEQRLWAGGSLTFNPVREWMLSHHNLAVLQEDVEDVKVKGKEGEEKVFVTISRKVAMRWALYRHAGRPPSRAERNLTTAQGANLGKRELGRLAMEEKKILVFMRAKTREQVEESLKSEPRVIKPIHEPDYSITITPSAHLLSRFSALTFNAHRIHLDRQYSREVEGHRNLLIHGPLSQVLMLSVLRSQLDHIKEEIVLQFDYKNIAPLYVDEPMRICTRRNPYDPNKFEVWIEGKEGGYAVKATAKVGPIIYREINYLLGSKVDVSKTEMRSVWTDLALEQETEMQTEMEAEMEAEMEIDTEAKTKPKSDREHFSKLIDIFKGKPPTK